MQSLDKTCWGSSSTCNWGRSQEEKTLFAQTWRMGDSWMNVFTYYAIRMQGTGRLKGVRPTRHSPQRASNVLQPCAYMHACMCTTGRTQKGQTLAEWGSAAAAAPTETGARLCLAAMCTASRRLRPTHVGPAMRVGCVPHPCLDAVRTHASGKLFPGQRHARRVQIQSQQHVLWRVNRAF